MSPRTGRPTENPKNEIIKVRATKDDREKLLYCCKKLGKTQYEIVMQGIDEVYKKSNKKRNTREIFFGENYECFGKKFPSGNMIPSRGTSFNHKFERRMKYGCITGKQTAD